MEILLLIALGIVVATAFFMIKKIFEKRKKYAITATVLLLSTIITTLIILIKAPLLPTQLLQTIAGILGLINSIFILIGTTLWMRIFWKEKVSLLASLLGICSLAVQFFISSMASLALFFPTIPSTQLPDSPLGDAVTATLVCWIALFSITFISSIVILIMRPKK